MSSSTIKKTLLLLGVVSILIQFFSINTTYAQFKCIPSSDSTNQCHDCKDNNSPPDGKADQYGVDINGDGILDLEPDPSCFSPTATIEKQDDVASQIIPCTDKCTFSDVFRLLNNFLKFFFTTLLIPFFVIIIMYAGYKYIAAQGNSSKIANIRSILWNITRGIILMLCAWLIVHTIMTTLLNANFKQSGVEFLGK